MNCFHFRAIFYEDMSVTLFYIYQKGSSSLNKCATNTWSQNGHLEFLRQLKLSKMMVDPLAIPATLGIIILIVI